jgi:hypothetical protein
LSCHHHNAALLELYCQTLLNVLLILLHCEAGQVCGLHQGLISPKDRDDYYIMVCPYSLVKSGHVSEALTTDRSKLGRSRNEPSVVPEVAATMQAEDRVHINVGGSLFVTYRQTLAAEPHSLLARLGQPSAQCDTTDQNGNIFIDRDGSQFRLILNFLRDGSCCLPSADQAVEKLLIEAQHYRVRAVYRLLLNKVV